MPLNVRRFGASCLVFLLLAGAVFAQATGSSAEDMQTRLGRARAFVAVRSYTAAAFELEKIRKESNDPSVQNIALMLLMNCHLENGDYKRINELLTETFTTLKATKGASSSSYITASTQVIKTARTQMDRYRQLGLNVADANIPAEVAAEIEKMRGTLETIVGQAKELSDSNKRSAEAFGLLEEVTNARSVMARDAYDSTRWKNEVADARDRLMNPQSAVVNVDETLADTTPTNPVQNNTTVASVSTPPVFTPVSAAVQQPTQQQTQILTANTTAGTVTPPSPSIFKEPAKQSATPATQVATAEKKADDTKSAETKPAQTRARVSGNSNQADDKPAPAENRVAETKTENAAPTSIGSLIDNATKKVAPVYPPMARNMRLTGVVRVDVVLGEEGEVLSAQANQGPEMLRRAAMDAIKQWKFKPHVKDGQPSKAAGFVNFNFAL